MPVFGLTRWGRKGPPSAGSRDSCGAWKALAARRLALRRLDCLRFGLAMMVGGLRTDDAGAGSPAKRRKSARVKVGPERRQAIMRADIWRVIGTGRGDRPPRQTCFWCFWK